MKNWSTYLNTTLDLCALFGVALLFLPISCVKKPSAELEFQWQRNIVMVISVHQVNKQIYWYSSERFPQCTNWVSGSFEPLNWSCDASCRWQHHGNYFTLPYEPNSSYLNLFIHFGVLRKHMAVNRHDLIENLLAVDALVLPRCFVARCIQHLHVMQRLAFQWNHQVDAVGIVVWWCWLTLKP